MAYSKQEKASQFCIDVKMVEQKMIEREISQRKLCKYLRKSHSWFTSLKRKSRTSPVYVPESTVLEIARELGCRIQDFKCAESSDPRYEPFQISSSREWAHRSINKMNDLDLYVISTFLYEIVEMENSMISAEREMADKNCEAKERIHLQIDYEKIQKEKDSLMWFLSKYFLHPEISDIVKSISEKNWWINIFLWMFRSKMEELGGFPTNSKLANTYTAKLQRDSAGKITSESKKEAEKALANDLASFINRMMNKMEDEDGTWNEIAKQCANKLSVYFSTRTDY